MSTGVRHRLVKLAEVSDAERQEREQRIRTTANVARDIFVPTAVGAGAGLAAGGIGGGMLGAGLSAGGTYFAGHHARSMLADGESALAKRMTARLSPRAIAIGSGLAGIAGGIGGGMLGASTLAPMGAMAGAGIGALRSANKAAQGGYKESSYEEYREPPTVLGGTLRGLAGGAALGAGVGGAVLGGRALLARSAQPAAAMAAAVHKGLNPSSTLVAGYSLGGGATGALYGGLSANAERNRFLRSYQ